MAENPLRVEREGDLREFGLPFAEGHHESDADDVIEPEPQEAPEAEEEEPVSQTPAEPTAAEPVSEEEEEEDLDEYSAMLARVREASQEKEETPEPDAESPEAAALKARLETLENQLRTYQPTEQAPAQTEPQPEDDGIDYSDPAVQKALAQAFSDPRTLGPTLKTVVEMETQRLLGKQIGPITEQIEKITTSKQEQEQTSERLAKLQRGLQASYQLGGLEAAIVMEAEEKGEGSLLYEYLSLNPHLLEDPRGIVTATLAVARAVEKADASLDQPDDSKKGPVPLNSKRQTRASKRGRNLNNPPEEKTPADQMVEEITAARGASSALEFMR
jgi:hypothetical protein